MDIESLGKRLALAVGDCLSGEGPGVDTFSLKFPTGKKVHVFVVVDKHEPLLRKAVEDLIGFNKSERERKLQDLRDDYERKLRA